MRAASAPVVQSANSPTDEVLRLTEWVHAIAPTARNPQYFLLQRLRATPLQVLMHGGDCADKSRLLWAALRAHGIPATMLMLFDPATKKPTHTVVEARVGEDNYMLADPAFNLVFPKPGGAGYYDLLDLLEDPDILNARLDELLSQANPPLELRAYRRDVCAYDHASSVNWNRNALTRVAFAILQPILGRGVYRLPRPLVLEEPKLAVAGAALGLAGMCMAGPYVLGRMAALANTWAKSKRCTEELQTSHGLASRDRATPSALSKYVAS